MVAGYNIATQSRLVKGRIGYMSQLFSLYPDLTVEQNLDFYGSIYGLSKKEKRIKKDWVIELAGLKGRESYLTRELAGGCTNLQSSFWMNQPLGLTLSAARNSGMQSTGSRKMG